MFSYSSDHTKTEQLPPQPIQGKSGIIPMFHDIRIQCKKNCPNYPSEPIMQKKIIYYNYKRNEEITVYNLADLTEYIQLMSADDSVIEYTDFPDITESVINAALAELSEGDILSDFTKEGIIQTIRSKIAEMQTTSTSAAKVAAEQELARICALAPQLKKIFQEIDAKKISDKQSGVYVGNWKDWHVHQYNDHVNGHVKYPHGELNFNLNDSASIIAAVAFLIDNGGLSSPFGKECYAYLRYQMITCHQRDLPEELRHD